MNGDDMPAKHAKRTELEDTATVAEAAAAAADDLADRLEALARQLASEVNPSRVRYGRGHLGGVLKRRSPAGFVIDAGNVQMLLPDGRLWSYSDRDAARYPAGRYFDVRADHANFSRGRSFFGGQGFIFLGAVVGSYTFGLVDPAGGCPHPGALSAISGEGGSLRYVDPDEAFIDIVKAILARADQGTAERGRA